MSLYSCCQVGREIMDKREDIQNLQPIDFYRYENVGLDHLVMITVTTLENIGADLSYENLTIGAFRLFPKKFSLTSYPEFPDGKRTHDSIFHCFYKSKGWLAGKTSSGYAITPKGRHAIKEAELKVIGTTSSKKSASKTRRKEAILEDLKKSDAFTKASRGLSPEITDSEFCHMLQVTLDAPRSVLNDNLSALLLYAEELGDIDAHQILSNLQTRFKSYLK